MSLKVFWKDQKKEGDEEWCLKIEESEQNWWSVSLDKWENTYWWLRSILHYQISVWLKEKKNNVKPRSICLWFSPQLATSSSNFRSLSPVWLQKMEKRILYFWSIARKKVRVVRECCLVGTFQKRKKNHVSQMMCSTKQKCVCGVKSVTFNSKRF